MAEDREPRIRHISEVAAEADPIPGRWGPWVYDPKGRLLTHRRERYEIPLDEMRTSAEILDWIMQLSAKSWLKELDLGHLVRAIDALLAPQAHFCSGGIEKGPVNVKELLGRLKIVR
jgi:hypothetical protein